MDGTILGQGSFVANFAGLANPNPGNAEVGQANPTIIQIPSNADWVKVSNFTQWGTAGNSGAYFNGTANAYPGFEFFWYRGMAAGQALVSYKANGAATVLADYIASGGFSLWNPAGLDPQAVPLVGAAIATSASTNVTRPVVSTANTAGLVAGTSIVRLSNTAQTDVNGIDFVVGAVSAGASFTLLTASNPLANAPGAIGGAGFYRVVNYDPLFYPRRRYVVNVTQAVNAQVSTSVAHNLTVGQEVSFNIPAVSGMVQLNPSAANNYQRAIVVSVVDSFNFTININTTGFTAFSWPTIAQQPSAFPQVVPMGEDSATSLSSNAAQLPLDIFGNPIVNANSGVLADSTVNTGFLGMLLGAGGNGNELTTPILGPAGSVAWSSGNVATGDVMYWLAGKSTYGGL